MHHANAQAVRRTTALPYPCATFVLAIAALFAPLHASAQTMADRLYTPDVRTAMLYTADAPLQSPMLVLGENKRMVLEFDVIGTEATTLRWSIVHCDRDWHLDDLGAQEFMTGWSEGVIDEYDASFATLTDYVHYRAVLPDEYATFTHSGNYAVVATTADGTDTLLTRRFCVSEQVATVSATIGRPYDGVEIDRRQEVDVCVSSRTEQLTPQYTHVVVQQNGRTDNMRGLEFSGYDARALCYRYRKCNVFEGGNTFRYFDMSNLRTPMYNVLEVEEYGGELMALIRPCANRSRSHFITETVLNGGMKVNAWDRNNPQTEAEYVWVNLSLPVQQPMLEGEVYVVGALTDWQLDSTARMDYDPRQHAYTKRLLLKQGYYAYQLLVRPINATEASTAPIEGNHHQTPNRYTIYVYQRTPADRADRIVAVHTIN